jgi:predicted site-specific integrase-resolvase
VERAIEQKAVRPGVAARDAGVSPATVARWAAEGKVAGAFRTAGGHWRVPADAVRRLLRPVEGQVA